MSKKSPIIVSFILLWIASLACGQSVSVPTLDPNAANTAIVETIIAIQAAATSTEAPVATPTPELPGTESLSPTPNITETPTTPQISVSVDTFCRVGPGTFYEQVGMLLVGETTEIVGRHATGEFWYVRNPDIGTEFCWISGTYATISGNVQVLLIHTPSAAAPVLQIDVSYDGLDQCTGWSARFRVQNLSDVPFKSMSMTVRDETTSTTQTSNTNGFTNTSSCNTPNTKDALLPGALIMVSSPEFSYDPNGNDIKATIMVCTDINLGGVCVTKVVTFKP